MPGYEDLTPDQIIAIMYLLFLSVLIYSSCRLIGHFIEFKTVKYLEVRIKKELAINPKSSLFTMIRSWWDKRKTKKQEKEDYFRF